MGNITDIDFDELLLQWLPKRFKSPKLIQWFKTFISPIKELYISFKLWESISKYNIKYQTGQVAHLEKVINEIFDNSLKRIYLGLGQHPQRVYLSLRLENDPIFLGQKYIYRKVDYEYGLCDFTVIVDNSLEGVIDESYLKAVINRYKRDSKNYIIKYESL